MSAREMARRIVAVISIPDADSLVLTDVIEHTINRAVEAEREACAVIAEAPHRATRGGGPADPQRIAAAIRARGAS